MDKAEQWEAFEEKRRAAIAIAIERQQVRQSMHQAAAQLTVPKVLRGEDPRQAWSGHAPVPVPPLPPDAATCISDSLAIAQQVHELLNHQERWIRLDDLEAILGELKRIGDDAAASKLKSCNDPDCGFVELCPNGDFSRLIPQRCWLRICPNCAKVIAQRLRDRLSAVLDKVASGPVPNWPLKHLTTTVKRSGDSEIDIKDFHTMQKALVHKLWTKPDRRAGASSFLEFGPLGGNVHAHTILFGRFVEHDLISDEWRRLSLKHRAMWQPWVKAQRAALESQAGHYQQELSKKKFNRSRRATVLRLLLRKKYSRKGIDRELLKRARRQGVGDRVVDIRVIERDRAIAEVVKYVTKLYKRDASSGRFVTPISDLVALHVALKGKRRAWSWGSFYGVDLDLDQDDDEHQAHECPKCGARLVGMPVEKARALLVLKDVNNCSLPGRTPAWRVAGWGPPPPLAA